MTNVSRWDPLSDLSTTMDRLFDEGFSRPWRFLRGGVDETMSFPVEVAQTDNEIEVRAQLPGVDPGDIDVSVNEDILMIKAETRKEFEEQQKNYYRQEFRYGAMQRAVSLPCRVEAGNAHATYENGILHLKLPKSESERPRQIKVQGAGSRPQVESGAQTQPPSATADAS